MREILPVSLKVGMRNGKHGNKEMATAMPGTMTQVVSWKKRSGVYKVAQVLARGGYIVL